MIVRVTDREGERHDIDAVSGWRVMEIIRESKLPIKAECGGALACATCHVYVAENWAARLHPPTPGEKELLDDAPGVRENSRLSCQIIMDENLDGLEVTLASGSEP